MDDGAGSERLLWQASLTGDARAFGALFDLHRAAVFRQAFRLAGGYHEAEEVAAVAFLELWRLRSRVRLVDGSVLPWLLVTTMNVARNSSRSARRYHALLERLPAASGDGSFEVMLDDLDRSSAIDAALARLPERDRRLAALVLVADIPVADAAIALGMHERTARNRVSLIRRRLQADLGDLHPTAPRP